MAQNLIASGIQIWQQNNQPDTYYVVRLEGMDVVAASGPLDPKTLEFAYRSLFDRRVAGRDFSYRNLLAGEFISDPTLVENLNDEWDRYTVDWRFS